MNKRRDKNGRFCRKPTKYTVDRETGVFPGGGRWEIVRNGQDHPGVSNLIKVEGSIYLPEGRESTCLEESLCFGDFLQILGVGLYETWGVRIEGGYRANKFSVKSATWREAFETARNKVETEADKLQSAISTRAKALENAEY